MKSTILCQQCASKQRATMQRIESFAPGFRCEKCRRLTKTAPCISGEVCVTSYDDLLDAEHDAIAKLLTC